MTVEFTPFKISVPQSQLEDLKIRLKKANTIVRWTEYEKGGHCAVPGVPDVRIKDVREFVGSLR
jgi:hypothetical protein